MFSAARRTIGRRRLRARPAGRGCQEARPAAVAEAAAREATMKRRAELERVLAERNRLVEELARHARADHALAHLVSRIDARDREIKSLGFTQVRHVLASTRRRSRRCSARSSSVTAFLRWRGGFVPAGERRWQTRRRYRSEDSPRSRLLPYRANSRSPNSNVRLTGYSAPRRPLSWLRVRHASGAPRPGSCWG